MIQLVLILLLLILLLILLILTLHMGNPPTANKQSLRQSQPAKLILLRWPKQKMSERQSHTTKLSLRANQLQLQVQLRVLPKSQFPNLILCRFLLQLQPKQTVPLQQNCPTVCCLFFSSC